MKTVIILYMLLSLTSAASAEVYTWEDENGINFSDNPSSTQEEYREVAFDETRVQTRSRSPYVRVETALQNRPVITHVTQVAVYQGYPEQQRQAALTIKQQPIGASAVSTKSVDNSFPSLATLVVAWILLALLLLVTWVFTIADTVKSNFITPTIKTAWVLLVILLPFAGMMFYYILGLSQKSNSSSCNVKQRFVAVARLTQ